MQAESDYRKLPIPAHEFADRSASRSERMRFAMKINRYLLSASQSLMAAMLLLSPALTPAFAGEVDDETTPYVPHVAPKGLGIPPVGGINPRNISSHSREFFERLLTGRVWVAHRPDYQGEHVIQNRVQAVYHGPDGTASSCWCTAENYHHKASRWRIANSRKRGLVNYYRSGTAPDPKKRKGHTPIFYDPGSGRLHSEEWIRRQVLWHRGKVGWVQDNWPRAMKDACPDLKLPAELPINEKQTSRFCRTCACRTRTRRSATSRAPPGCAHPAASASPRPGR